MKRLILIGCLLVVEAITINAQKAEYTNLSGLFQGQNPVGLIPEKFNPGLVSENYSFYANLTFNPDFNEVYWTPNFEDPNYHGGLIVSKLQNGTWTKPREIHFLDSTYSLRSPFYGYDGRRLYFQAYLGSNKGWDQKEKFYYTEKNTKGWSVPRLLDTIFNKYAVHWQFSLDKKNNLYFGGDLRGKENSGGIYFSKYQEGKYLEPVLIYKNIELDEAVFGPAISPMGNYILFARIHPRGSTNPRIFSIYISFRKSEYDWTEPKELGEKLNMDGNQPRISPDGKYIFFIGNDGMAYWVDAKIIDVFRPKD